MSAKQLRLLLKWPLVGGAARTVLRQLQLRHAKKHYAPRLAGALKRFLDAIKVKESSALADQFAATVNSTDPLLSKHIVKDIELFERNVAAARETARSPAAHRANSEKGKPERAFRILFVEFLAPSRTHAGGLRVFDIIQHLRRAHGYEVYLYSRVDEEQDESSRRALSDLCAAVRYAEFAEYGEDDLLRWLEGLRVAIDDFDVIQFEWIFYLDRFSSIFDSRPVKFVTHQENQLRRHSLDLNGAGEKTAWRSRTALSIFELTRDACHESIAYARIPNHIMLTEADRDFAQQFGPRRLEIIPTGLNEEFLGSNSEAIKVKRDQLCFVGFFGHGPNVEAALWLLREVIPIVEQALPTVKVLFVGRGSTPELARFAGPGVSFTGEVHSVVPYIIESEICLAPLISGAGFRGKVNQYSILGRPTVATSVAVSGLLYKDDESMVIADSPEAFANAILRLRRDREFQSKLAQRAQAVAREHYSWGPIIRRLDQLYRGSAPTKGNQP